MEKQEESRSGNECERWCARRSPEAKVNDRGLRSCSMTRRYAFADYEKDADADAPPPAEDGGDAVSRAELEKQYVLYTVRPYRPVQLTVTAE